MGKTGGKGQQWWLRTVPRVACGSTWGQLLASAARRVNACTQVSLQLRMHAAKHVGAVRRRCARRTHSKEKSLWGPWPFHPGQRSRTWSLKQVPLRMASWTAGSSMRLSGGANW